MGAGAHPGIVVGEYRDFIDEQRDAGDGTQALGKF